MALPDRIVVPREVFVTMCVSLSRLSDSLLAAVSICSQQTTAYGDLSNNALLAHLTRLHTSLTEIEFILRVITEETREVS